MHVSYHQALWLLLPFALARPGGPSTAPLAEIGAVKDQPASYGIYLDVNVPQPPPMWQLSCNGEGNSLCANIADNKVHDQWVFNGAGESCQGAYFWPSGSHIAVPTRGECSQLIFTPLAEALSGNATASRASSNVALGGFPMGGSPGAPIDPKLPRFILQA